MQVDIASHSGTEARDGGRIPSGLEFWSVDVDITQLEVVFLYRFLQVGGAALPVRLLHGRSAQYTVWAQCGCSVPKLSSLTRSETPWA